VGGGADFSVFDRDICSDFFCIMHAVFLVKLVAGFSGFIPSGVSFTLLISEQFYFAFIVLFTSLLAGSILPKFYHLICRY